MDPDSIKRVNFQDIMQDLNQTKFLTCFPICTVLAVKSLVPHKLLRHLKMHQQMRGSHILIYAIIFLLMLCMKAQEQSSNDVLFNYDIE